MTDEQTSAMTNVQDAAAALNRAIDVAADAGLRTKVIADQTGGLGRVRCALTTVPSSSEVTEEGLRSLS